MSTRRGYNGRSPGASVSAARSARAPSAPGARRRSIAGGRGLPLSVTWGWVTEPSEDVSRGSSRAGDAGLELEGDAEPRVERQVVVGEGEEEAVEAGLGV